MGEVYLVDLRREHRGRYELLDLEPVGEDEDAEEGGEFRRYVLLASIPPPSSALHRPAFLMSGHSGDSQSPTTLCTFRPYRSLCLRRDLAGDGAGV